MAGIASLPLFHRIAGQPVIVLGDGAEAEPKRRLVERAGGDVITNAQDGIDRGARLAFVALEDPGDCEAAAIRLRCAGLLVNVVDRPELCDFTTPSILDRDPVLVAIGTSGASAGLAKQLRLRLEALLPSGLGRLANALHASRTRLRALFPNTGERRQALDRALGVGGVLDPLDPAAPDRVGDWLDGTPDAASAGVIEFTITSDDPEDLTFRQARLLGSADMVLHDPAIAPAVLDRARADARRRELPADPPADAALVVVLRKGSA
ncbi:precorrin-2 dehydrogenase/sirohydrochlorin ferrochelatase family protein [Paraurantiacibacter namhicola]|uniref:precorrin-2 dehydrogenase n=1 Tax=Paraurantiacibacter namhicola TaxID=645517 RepID=A0A1C7D7E8_9SPHN|nr:bifunctional precorrin-2 dehydrogenase/sirohydrochlorin ferrochelatase [Paraurantiacibacter namhicola]ANU07399.1 Siroheme synthase [Paraurantiacibacter namhicola]